MPNIEEQFELAQATVKQLAKVSTEQQLQLYGLFKQATVGDVVGARPGMLDVRGRAKYDAWAARKGVSQNAARQAYVDLVAALGKA